MMKLAISAAGIACAATLFVPSANAEPAPDANTIVGAQSPNMTCQIFSAAPDPMGDSVDCQGEFPQAPLVPTEYADGTLGPPSTTPNQAMVTAAGKLTYFSGNIGMGGILDENGNAKMATMTNGKTYHLRGWTVVPTADGITFTNDATSHGMTVDDTEKVTAF